MVYKEKIQQMLESMTNKVLVVQRAVNGSIQMNRDDLNKLLNDIKELSERISSLVDNER